MTPPSQPPVIDDLDIRAPAPMGECAFRFYHELNDFLSPARRNRLVRYRFQGTPAVKDAIEALGVPHTEVDAILVDDASVSFGQKLHGGERVAVYPRSARPDSTPLRRLRPAPARTPRFVADVHLGTLARYLRLLGFDTLYDRGSTDEQLLRQAIGERRILLSRDVALLKYGILTHARYVHATRPELQLEELVRAFDLAPRAKPFTRCMICNGRLRRVAAASVVDELPAGTRQTMRRFKRCAACRKIYWPGTHFERLQRIVARTAA